MIRELRVSNFRSLGDDVRLSLGPLTVLVGVNGSGKSNVVDVLAFLSDCMAIGLEGAITQRHGIAAVRRWSSGHPRNVAVRVDVHTEAVQGVYEFELAGDEREEYRVKREHLLMSDSTGPHEYLIERGPQDDGRTAWRKSIEGLRPNVDALNLALPLLAGDERFRPFVDELRGLAVYSIFPDQLRQPQKYDPKKPMNRHGANWVSILKDQPEQSWKPDLLTVLNRLTGDIVDVRVRAVAGYLTVQFEHQVKPGSKRRKHFESSQESDGTLRVAGMLTALLQEPRPSVIVLEEPELTVHPGVLPLLSEYVEEASENVQVVLTTHSPELLELLEADQLRVVERRDGATTVAPLDEGQREVVKQGLFGLGEVLRREGLQQSLRFGAEE